MDFVTVDELLAEPSRVLDKVVAGKTVAITRDGEPVATMTPTLSSEMKDKLRALRSAKFGTALSEMQRHAVKIGLDKMTLKEINAEIAASRGEIRERDARAAHHNSPASHSKRPSPK